MECPAHSGRERGALDFYCGWRGIEMLQKPFRSWDSLQKSDLAFHWWCFFYSPLDVVLGWHAGTVTALPEV
jgi:hypothetical protein